MHKRELWCPNLAAAWSKLAWERRRFGTEQHPRLRVNLLRHPPCCFEFQINFLVKKLDLPPCSSSSALLLGHKASVKMLAGAS